MNGGRGFLTGTSRGALYLTCFFLFALTFIHTPFPKFRGLTFEYFRDFGVYVFLGWVGVFLITAVLLFFSKKRREVFLLLLLSVVSAALLLAPMVPYYDSRFLEVFDDATKSDERSELLIIESRKRTSDLEALVVGTPQDFVWLIHEDSLERWSGQEVGCKKRLPGRKGARSLIYSSFSCDLLEEFSLREGESAAIQIRHEDFPIYIFQMKPGSGREVLYGNMLSIRRLAAVLKHLPTTVVLYSGEITPWSNLYWILGFGGELFDVAWGRSIFFSLRDLFSKDFSKTRSVLFKGNIVPRSFTYLEGEGGERVGYKAVLLTLP